MKLHLRLFFLFLISFPGFGQSITGQIVDYQTSKPISGAHVQVLQTPMGAYSRTDGHFSIAGVSAGAYTIRITQVGYETVEQSITVIGEEAHHLRIALPPALLQLNKAIVVTAQRQEVQQFNRPEAISVLTQQELQQRAPRSTPEALTGVTGIWMQKTNHGGGSPFIRGLTGQQTLLLVDGIRLNNATFRYGPNQYLNTIDPQNLAQIEVVRGSGSVQYGSDALGGAINLITRTPQFSGEGTRFTGSVYGKYMSGDMERSGRAEVSVSSERVAVLGGFALRKFGDIVAGGNLGILNPTGYDQLSGDLKARFRLTNRQVLTVAYQLVDQSKVPLYHKVQLENYAYNYFDPQRRQLSYARLESFSQNKWFQQITFTGSVHQSWEGRIARKNGSETVLKEDDKINTIGASLLVNSAPASFWTFNSGIEYYHDRVNSRRTDANPTGTEAKRGLYPDGSSANSLALFSLHTLDFTKLILTAGGRFNVFDVRIVENTLGESRIQPKALVGNIGASYAIHPNYRLVASLNTAFRAPNVDDMGTLGIVDFRYEVPNTRLQPERSTNMEAGLKSRAERISASVVAFRHNLSGIISRIRRGDTIQEYPVYLKENTAEAYIQGIEADAEVRLIGGLAAFGNFVYTYGQNITANEPYRRIPPLNTRLGLYYRYKGFWSRIEWLHAEKQSRLAKGDMDDNRIPEGGTPGWNVVNVSGGYQTNWYTLSAEFHNLFDEAYKTHGSGVYGYGRSFWISGRIHF